MTEYIELNVIVVYQKHGELDSAMQSAQFPITVSTRKNPASRVTAICRSLGIDYEDISKVIVCKDGEAIWETDYPHTDIKKDKPFASLDLNL